MTITPPPDDTPSDDMPQPETPDEVPIRDEPPWQAPGSEEGSEAPMRMPGDPDTASTD